MKKHTTLFASSFLGIFLAISMLNSTPIVSALHTPSDVIQTGDQFTFDESFNSSSESSRFFTMYNQFNASELYHGDDESMTEFIVGSGSADVGFIRETGQVPNLGEYDTWVSVRSESETLPGSYREEYRNSTDQQNGQPPMWGNPEPHYEDLSGRHNSDEQSIGMMSNATFAVIFPEIFLTQVNMNDGGNNGDEGLQFPGFDGNIPRTAYYVTTGSLTLTINGVSRTINTKTIHVVWSVNVVANETQKVWFGEENDPQTPTGMVDIDLTLGVYLHNSYTYDSGNTLLVQTSSQAEINIDYLMPAQNLTLVYDNGTLTDTNVTISQVASGNYSEYRMSQISEADNFYGSTRPGNTGSPRLTAGEYLEYELDQGDAFWMNWDVHLDSTQGHFYQELDAYFATDVEGSLVIDVYRHAADMFDAVMILEGVTSYDFEASSYMDDDGKIDQPPAEEVHFSQDSFFMQLISMPTDAQHDIMPFFEDKMYLDFDLFGNCNGPDCFYLDYPREVNPTGPVNVSNYYINLVEEFQGSGDDYPVINGFTQYEFNVEEHTQLYELDYTQNMQLPLGDSGIMMPVTLKVYADGSQSFFYDADTGALVAMNQGLYGELTLSGSGTLTISDENGSFLVDYDILIEMEWDSWFDILLSGHPDYYDSQPTMPPVPTTSTSTSSSTNESSADLPLPIPFGSIFIGLFTVGIIVRKRK